MNDINELLQNNIYLNLIFFKIIKCVLISY